MVTTHTRTGEPTHNDAFTLIHSSNWSPTGLGPKDQWPKSLARQVDLLLAHPLPMIVLWGPDLIQIYNDGYAQIAGNRHPAALGMPNRECWPEVWHINAPIYARVTEHGESIQLVDQLFPVSRDGITENLYFSISYSPAFDDDGRIAGVFISVSDTTQKVLAERERVRLLQVLENERATLAAIVEKAPAFICMLRGPDLLVELSNEQHNQMIGGRAIIGLPLRTALPELAGQGFFERLDSVYATGQPFVGTEMPIRLHNPHAPALQRFITFIYQPVRAPDHSVSGIFIHGVDVTERRRIETELRRMTDVAESANYAKDKFLAALSHELRTPLTPIVMIAASMELNANLPPEFKEDVALIRRNVDLETRLIDDLLDLSRVATGKMRLQIRPIDVHAVIVHALRTLEPDLYQKKLVVQSVFAADGHCVDGDPARLQQVLWNLLKNAIKFTPEGGRVTIATRNAADTLVIDVRDTGRGIDAVHLPRIFDPFEQGDAGVTRQFGGMGLGLAIAKAIVDLHVGSISAASDGPGRGTTFTVTLPLSAQNPTEPIPVDTGLVPPDTARVKLLLVEDHLDTGRTLKRFLGFSGYEVRWADSVAMALKIAAAESFDLVISDVGLLDGSGHDLMREVMRLYALPGIAMSGYGMDDDIRQSRAAGFAEHLIKPLTLPHLVAAIGRVARPR